MGTILFLVIFPLIVGLALLVLKTDAGRDVVVTVASVVIAAASIFLCIQYFGKGEIFFDFKNDKIDYGMVVIEACLAVVIIVLGIKYKKYLASVLVAIQAPLIIWFELTRGHKIDVGSNIYLDNLSLVMVLIIGIIGTMICVYAIPYMKDFQSHHPEQADRRPVFFCLLFVFLSAMFGIVASNNLLWMFFFWELTTICSFLLIGYTKTPEAVRNSFRALIINLAGGLSFAVGIVFLGIYYDTLEFDFVIWLGARGDIVILIPITLFAFAALTKSAQMPFNSWLLGAMVAPTPTSALLHSSAMVKAGVFMIIQLSPALGFNIAGVMVMMVGGITFLMASLAAISQSNAKKVLAYSTVANLGLIVACGGIGTAGAVWAGIMLIIFHAITKSLLFLCVGTAEHNLGSKNIEDMDGLFNKMPRLAVFMMIGIAGMFLAPFGMLVSKWAAMTAFVNSMNIFLVMMICFGSAATIFYWTKWLGKMAAVIASAENIQINANKREWGVLGTLACFTVLICLLFPAVSSYAVVPYLEQIFRGAGMDFLSTGIMWIMFGMIATIVLLPVFFFGKTNKKIVHIYLSGVNTGDDLTFHGSMDKKVPFSLRNWYMEKYFNEFRVNVIGAIAASFVIAAVFSILIGGALL